MVRHFETKKQAVEFANFKNRFNKEVEIFKKLKGHKNRIKKPFVVCTYGEWVNLY